MSFRIKLPVFTFDGGRRGLMVAAKVDALQKATVTFLMEDGQMANIEMEASRVAKASQQGPFVNLVEVAIIGGDAMGLSLLGANGRPI